MNKLREFAEEVFKDYNSEGSRRAENIKEVSSTDREIIYEYDYISLTGDKRKLSKKFYYNQDDEMVHDGPLPVEEI